MYEIKRKHKHNKHDVQRQQQLKQQHDHQKQQQEPKQQQQQQEKRQQQPPARFTAFHMVPQGRDGAEKGRALGERTEERKEKREKTDNHNPDERAAE